MESIDCSVYDALNTSVAESLGVDLADVTSVLAHREVFDDGFWMYWDAAVARATSLYSEIQGVSVPVAREP